MSTGYLNGGRLRQAIPTTFANGITETGGVARWGGALTQNTTIEVGASNVEFTQSGSPVLAITASRQLGIRVSSPATQVNTSGTTTNQTDGATALGSLGFGYEVAQAGYVVAFVNTNNATSSNGLIVRIARANADARALWVGTGSSPVLAALGNGWVGVGTVPTARFHVAPSSGGPFTIDDSGFVNIPAAGGSGASGIRTTAGISLGFYIAAGRVFFIPETTTGSATISRPALQIGNGTNTGDVATFFSADPTHVALRAGSGTAGSAGSILFRTRNDLTRAVITADGAFGVGTGLTPAVSAIAEFRSNTQGVLFPRMTTAERNLIPTPVNGLVVYNSDANKFQGYAGGAWVDFH